MYMVISQSVLGQIESYDSGAVNYAQQNPTVDPTAVAGGAGSGLSNQFGDAIIGGSQTPSTAFNIPNINQQFTTAATQTGLINPLTANPIVNPINSIANPALQSTPNLDRRVRLRPKSGATQLYYTGNTTSGNNALSARQIQLQQGLGQQLPWLSNPAAPNAQLQGNTSSGFGPSLGGISSNPLGSLLGSLNLSSIGNALGFTGSSGRNGQVQQQTNTLGGLTIGAISSSTNGNNSMPGVMNILAQTNGAVFPYTPTVDIQQSVDYSTMDPVHSLQEFHAFTRTKAPTINISGKFSSQNATEAQYCFAFLMFCRTVSKMSFGISTNPSPGTPPPILLLDGYGNMLNAIPVIMTNFSFSLPDDVDYIQIINSTTWVPSLFSISISLTVQHTPAELRQFNLDAFRQGTLLQGWM